jgi:hypothetical protein
MERMDTCPRVTVVRGSNGSFSNGDIQICAPRKSPELFWQTRPGLVASQSQSLCPAGLGMIVAGRALAGRRHLLLQTFAWTREVRGIRSPTGDTAGT